MKRSEIVARHLLKGALGVIDRHHVRPAPRILIYHQVGSGLAREMEVSEAAFRAQMTHLAEHHDVVSLDEAIERADDSVVVTIDDGYRDTYTTALPILEDLGLPFTLYLATESIETGRSLGPSLGAEPLTWAQIEEISARTDVTIGAHTHTHRDLREADAGTVEWEIEQSDDLLDRRLGVRANHFAYPWGYWGEQAHGVLARRYASAVLGGGEPTLPLDPMLLNRIPIQLTDTFRGFVGKLRHGGRSEERIRRAVKRYDGP